MKIRKMSLMFRLYPGEYRRRWLPDLVVPGLGALLHFEGVGVECVESLQQHPDRVVGGPQRLDVRRGRPARPLRRGRPCQMPGYFRMPIQRTPLKGMSF